MNTEDGDHFSLRSSTTLTSSGVSSNINSYQSTDTISSKEEESGDVGVGDLLDALYCFKGPKRIRLPRRVVPRLLRSDPRRHYASMLVNALNSHDMSYLQSFFERYMIPNATVSHPAVKSELMTKPSLLIVGIDNIVRFRSFHEPFVPDQVTRAENVKVVRYGNREISKVVCDIKLTWTQIYDHHCVHRFVSSVMRLIPNVEIKEVPDGYEYRSTTGLTENGGSRELSQNSPGPVCPYAPTLLTKLRKMQMVMPLTLHINELRQISSVEFGSALVE